MIILINNNVYSKKTDSGWRAQCTVCQFEQIACDVGCGHGQFVSSNITRPKLLLVSTGIYTRILCIIYEPKLN